MRSVVSNSSVISNFFINKDWWKLEMRKSKTQLFWEVFSNNSFIFSDLLRVHMSRVCIYIYVNAGTSTVHYEIDTTNWEICFRLIWSINYVLSSTVLAVSIESIKLH